MSWYSVRTGDTLWSIAVQIYGDGQLWSYLADHNPLARCGALFEGQELAVPPRPDGPMRSLADPSRAAAQLGHLPVRLSLDASVPYFFGWSEVGTCWLRADLTFYRRGAVDLRGDLGPNRLMVYRFLQLEWAFKHFVRHLTGGHPRTTDPWRERIGEPHPIYYHEDCAIVGWLSVRTPRKDDVPFDAQGFYEWELKCAQKALASACLLLDEPDSLGPLLRSACPYLISPAQLWAVSRDRRYLPVSSPWISSAAEAPTASVNGKVKPKKESRKLASRKPPTKKTTTRAVKTRRRAKAKA